MARKDAVNWLKVYVGCKEGGSGHKGILKVFNDSGLCSRYKMTVNDAWCATAVSAAFIGSGQQSIFPCVECSCEYMVKLAQKYGIWIENDAYVPEKGDVILYDWQDTGVGDNTGWSDHVGIVDKCDGVNIKVIEGNINDTVGYRNIKVNARYIRGFIVPKYGKEDVNMNNHKCCPNWNGCECTKDWGSIDVDKLAKEVIRGKYGSGKERKDKLESIQIGLYAKVQQRVNEILRK